MFLDPQQARAMYESMMEEQLYKLIGDDKGLKAYVDSMYSRERYYRWFVSAEIFAFTLWIFFFYIAPEVNKMFGGA